MCKTVASICARVPSSDPPPFSQVFHKRLQSVHRNRAIMLRVYRVLFQTDRSVSI